jgi:hypothetical protein
MDFELLGELSDVEIIQRVGAFAMCLVCGACTDRGDGAR